MLRFRAPAPSFLLPTLLLLPACADGAKQDIPRSEVQVGANHHLLWFRSLPGFGAAATRAEAIFPGHGVLQLATDSTYRIQLSSGTTAAERYALAATGGLSIYNTGSGREPSTVFPGAYRLVGDQPDFYFLDQVSAGSSASIGLYFGTKVQPGQVELEGGWHVLSLHVMLTPGTAALPRNVGRAAHGEIAIGAGAAGALRTISGTGSESSNDATSVAPVTFGGSIQNLLDNTGVGDGACNLTLDYTNTGSPVDPRVFRAVAGKDLVLALDEDETDGEAGLAFLVRKFDAPTTPAVTAALAGDWLVGGHTVFVNPTNNGSDAFLGTLALTAQGAFRLDAQDHLGGDFAYTGTFTTAVDGRLTFSVAGTNETWTAAVNRAYDTLILVDDVVENRTNNTPELNLVVGVRKKIN